MTDDEIRELWEERAAVREYDGGLKRERAELLAARDVKELIKPQPLPLWLIRQVCPNGVI